VRWVTEIVNGVCPDCAKNSILISVDQYFKCTRCGTELEQKVNGKISYIPTGAKPEEIRMVLKNNGEEV
jgi:tRNA(Ile2) C34 agmatinyltransferase TiaS